MSEPQKTSWIYHPLSGNELLKWIFSDAFEKLTADNVFQPHLAYHNPVYKLHLEVKAFDRTPQGTIFQTNEVGSETFGQKTTSDEEILDMEAKKIVKMVSNEEPLLTPDKARDQLDEGRYKVVKEDNILVDKKIKREQK